MKKTQKVQFSFLWKFICFLCLIFFNLSCGLDIIEYYEPPIPSVVADPDNVDINERYIEFWTNNSENTSTSFKGTNVFYRIYNNQTEAENQKNTLINLSKNDYTSTIVDRLEKDYGYKKLNNSNNLFPKNGSTNDRIRIDFTDPDGNFKIIYNNGLNEKIPVRIVINGNDNNPFHFNFNSSYWTYDSERDVDIKYSSSSADNKWYVQFFAASVGLSNTYTEQYSNIVYLGCVAFDN